MTLKYRKDIDGLRALAVLLVVLYHAGFSFLSGGFVGVDVFFVISGFLITSIIYKAIYSGDFSLVEFYIKRVKRILPSFYIVVITTVILGYFILLPSDFVGLAKSALASTFFVANIYFWKTTGGYFNTNTDELPLLHLWSLSVEEQFYFIWPFLLILLVKVNLKRLSFCFLVLLVIFLFLFSQWAAINKPNAAYYFLPTRAGELLLGGGLGIAIQNGFRLSRLTSSFFSLLGLGLIIGSSFVLTKSSIFPGFYALLPCIGASLIILAGNEHQPLINRILSKKYIVFIGLISYPLYLWHWPIIAYSNYLNYELDLFSGSLAVIASIGLATMTWIFLEKQVQKIKCSRTFTFIIFFIIPVSFFTLISLTIIFKSGYKERFLANEDYNEAKKIMIMPTIENGWCYRTKEYSNAQNFRECYLGNKNFKNTNAIFIGDSHAGHYQDLIDYIGTESDLKVSTFITSNCFPSLNYVDSENFGGNPNLCKLLRIKVEELINEKNIKVIFLAAKWDANLEWLYETQSALNVFSSKVKRVLILPQVKSYSDDIAKGFLKSQIIPYFNTSKDYNVDKRYNIANKSIEALASKFSNVDLLTVPDVLGDSYISDDGLPLYFDNNHLNIYGSQYLKEKFSLHPSSHLLLELLKEED